MEDILAAEQTSSAFQLKGSLFTLTVMQIMTTDKNLVATQLDALIERTPKFFNQMPMVLDIAAINRSKKAWSLKDVVTVLREHNIIPIGIRGGMTEHNQQALELNLAIMPSSQTDKIPVSEKPVIQQPAASADSHETPTTKIITKPVRSGQQIYAQNSDLVIISSVSHGAELLADGNIHVYGALRGRALAGVNGNTHAHIFCGELDAELISVAGYYMVKEDVKRMQLADNSLYNIFLENERLQITRIM